MTPVEKAEQLKKQYGDKALEVCGTLYGALMNNPINDNRQNHPSQENKISFWWEVLLELGYDA